MRHAKEGEIMQNGLRFRLATPLDHADILAFQRAAVARVVSDHYPPEALAAWYRCPAPRLEAMIWSGRYLLAMKNGRPIAGAGWEPVPDDPGAGMVRAVFVHPVEAGRGVGRALMARIEEGIFEAGLERAVVPAALDAVPFYQRLGYRLEGPCRLDLRGTPFECRILRRSLWRLQAARSMSRSDALAA
jgi:GNAT superfamily N-acetyltransferase